MPCRPGPHEAADGVLRVDEAGVVDDLDRGHPHVRGDADDAHAVAGGADGAGHVGAVVAGGGPPAGGGGVRAAGVRAVDRVRDVDVGGEVRVVGVDARVEDADDTLRLPSVIRWAWSALIICRSHCSVSRGSAVVATVGSLPTSPLTSLLRVLLVARGAGAPGRLHARGRALRDRDAAGGAHRLEGLAGGGGDVGAERRAVGVRDDDPDLRARTARPRRRRAATARSSSRTWPGLAIRALRR